MTNEEIAKELHTTVDKDMRLFGRVSYSAILSAVRKAVISKDEEIAAKEKESASLRKDIERLEAKVQQQKEDIAAGRKELLDLRDRVFELKELLRDAAGKIPGPPGDRIAREVIDIYPLPKKPEDP